MKTLCLFSSYSISPDLPEYIITYLSELKNYFTEVRLLTNERVLSSSSNDKLKQHDIKLCLLVNEGYDFGMWSKSFNDINLDEWDQIALVNDSCVLFRSLKETMNSINASNWDYSGLISSYQVSWHIQSFFIVMRKSVFTEVKNYFNTHGLKSSFNDVIQYYEVGLCSHLLKKNYKLGALFTPEEKDALLNPSFERIDQLIRKGYPLIKRKLVTGDYRNSELYPLLMSNFRFQPSYYYNIINHNVDHPLLDVKAFVQSSVSWQRRIKLLILSVLSTILGLVIKIVRRIKKVWIKK